MAENQAGAAADALEVLREKAGVEGARKAVGCFEELERLRVEEGGLVFIPFVVVVGRTRG